MNLANWASILSLLAVLGLVTGFVVWIIRSEIRKRREKALPYQEDVVSEEESEEK